MTHLALFVLLGLVSKYCDFLAFAVLKNFCINGSLCAILACFNALAVVNSNNIIESYLGISFCAELLNIKHIAFGNLVLLTTGYDNSVH